MDTGSTTGPTKGAADGETLVLIPTALEERRVEDHGGIDPALARTLVCGFGVVAAAARATQLILELRPRRVILLGICGAYDTERHPVGSAMIFTRTSIDGVGAGEGASFRGPSGLGFPQWPGSSDTREAPIEEELALDAPARTAEALLLTTCAASDSDAEARTRLERHPSAVAEDMEGFAVAMAGALTSVPVTIVRGVSNRVGDRDPSHWQIPGALAAARKLVLDLLEAGAGTSS